MENGNFRLKGVDLKMGVCGCGSENKFYKVGDKLLVLEKFDYCEDCGNGNIQINVLADKDKDCFSVLENIKIPKLSNWMSEGRKNIIITANDFSNTIKEKLEIAFSNMWDNFIDKNEKEFDKISDKTFEFIEKHTKKQLLELLKED